MKKTIIVGTLPLIDISFLKEEKQNHSFLIACDGGYESFLKAGIEPDLFIGDFDTLPKMKIKNPKEIIELNTHKDDTDTFVAIKKAIERNSDEIHLYGCLGGKIEHTIGNIQLLYYITNQHMKAYLYSQDIQTVVHMISNSCIRLIGKEHEKFSLFSYNSKAEKVTIKGALYELNDATLTNDVPLGVSNEFIGNDVVISVKEGTLLLVTPKDSLVHGT